MKNYKKNTPIYNESLKAKYNIPSNLKMEESNKLGPNKNTKKPLYSSNTEIRDFYPKNVLSKKSEQGYFTNIKDNFTGKKLSRDNLLSNYISSTVHSQKQSQNLNLQSSNYIQSLMEQNLDSNLNNEVKNI